MTPLYERKFRQSDRIAISATGNALASQGRDILLPMGGANAQGFSNKCAAAACLNTLETCDAWLDEPLPTMNALYENARLLAGMEKHERGSFPAHVAESACRLLDGAARWMRIPLESQIMRNWLLTEKTGIFYGMQWTAGHSVSAFGRNDILFPNDDKIAPGHAVCINGYQSAREFRKGFLWTQRKAIPVFSIENTHQHARRRFYIQTAEVPVYGLSAIVFVPPDF